ncbi:50S ribosomal protein L5 [Candidatus Shikimatogenerans bostrichidophilus]|uniref:50S ribosomal protein L5 n=1 Tax=Candidatus Shikimatogenerans bostrichidophilus TaxID=2943807 RepID=UPI0029672DE5
MMYIPRLKLLYDKKIINILKKKLKYKNIMQVPKLKKIVINIGVGIKNKNYILDTMEDLSLLTGQKSTYRLSKKDISGLNLRKGTKIGCMVTLRRNIMYEFLERLISVALPRSKDFNGIKENSFDGKGNYNLGIKEHIIFPEINFEKVKRIYGMNISFVTSTKYDKEAKYLLIYLGLPFKNKNIYGKRKFKI